MVSLNLFPWVLAKLECGIVASAETFAHINLLGIGRDTDSLNHSQHLNNRIPVFRKSDELECVINWCLIILYFNCVLWLRTSRTRVTSSPSLLIAAWGSQWKHLLPETHKCICCHPSGKPLPDCRDWRWSSSDSRRSRLWNMDINSDIPVWGVLDGRESWGKGAWAETKSPQQT